ncbi:nitroreductase [candidate division KSB1 bacterium]|nr:nitroreductase [candidate division KSB1 bacterium]
MITHITRRHAFKKLLALGSSLSLISLFTRKTPAVASNDQPALNMNETLETIHSMRTIHGDFNETDISDRDLETILYASVQAANSSAMQTYSIIVVKNRDIIQKLTGYTGSRLLVYCVDYNRLKASASHLGHQYIPGDMTSFITGSTNTILAAQTAVIAAKSLGIDSLLTNGIHRGDMQRVWDILELPNEHCYPLIALVLGYPNHEPEYRKGRLDGVGVIHHDKYHSLTTVDLEMINNAYNDKTKHLGLRDDWEAQGCKNYLDWLFSKWLGRNDRPAKEETKMFTFLKRSGFVEP